MGQSLSVASSVLAALALGAPSSALASSNKFGLCCEGCNATQYGPFASAASWAYRYELAVSDPSALAWMNKNGVEFVPMVAHHEVNFFNGSKCDFNASTCTAHDIAAALMETSRALTGAPVRFLMAWNEAYDRNNYKSGKKWIPPHQAALWWGTILQPAATLARNLSLVSPTTGVETKKLVWLAQFLMACLDLGKQDGSCDVQSVAAFSVHDYKCAGAYWKDNYGDAREGAFQRKLVKALGGHGDFDWAEYVASRPIWVTETNCNGDGDQPGYQETCMRASGQRASEKDKEGGYLYGEGSFSTILDSLDTVSRVSWWNVYHKDPTGKQTFASLVHADGKLTPPGMAILARGRHVDCETQVLV